MSIVSDDACPIQLIFVISVLVRPKIPQQGHIQYQIDMCIVAALC